MKGGTQSSLVWVAAVALLAASPARADDAVDPDVAAAEKLFREGRKAFEAGDLDRACKKLQASLELDPGIGTRWHLARCYEESGRAATAWALFAEVAQEAQRLGRPQQQQAAIRRARDLEPKICRLVVQVESTPLDRVSVSIDGRVLQQAAWGTPLPVDCGTHTLETELNGQKAKQKIQVKKPGQNTEVAAPMPKPEADGTGGGKGEGEGGGDGSKPGGPAWYGDIFGWGLLGSGLAAGGAAVFYYLRASDLEDEAREPGLDLTIRDDRFDRADQASLISLTLAGAGAALVVAGAVKLGLHDRGGAAITPTDRGATASVWLRF